MQSGIALRSLWNEYENDPDVQDRIYHRLHMWIQNSVMHQEHEKVDKEKGIRNVLFPKVYKKSIKLIKSIALPKYNSNFPKFKEIMSLQDSINTKRRNVKIKNRNTLTWWFQELAKKNIVIIQILRERLRKDVKKDFKLLMEKLRREIPKRNLLSLEDGTGEIKLK